MHGSVVLLKFHWIHLVQVACSGFSGKRGSPRIPCQQQNSGCGGPAQQPSCKPYNLSLILFNIKDLERTTEGQLSSKRKCTFFASMNLDTIMWKKVEKLFGDAMPFCVVSDLNSDCICNSNLNLNPNVKQHAVYSMHQCCIAPLTYLSGIWRLGTRHRAACGFGLHAWVSSSSQISLDSLGASGL